MNNVTGEVLASSSEWTNRLGEEVEVTVYSGGWIITYFQGEPREGKHWSERTRDEARDLSRRRVPVRFTGTDPEVRGLCLAACSDRDLAPLAAAWDRLAGGEVPDFGPAAWDAEYVPWFARAMKRGWKRLGQLLTGAGLDAEDVLKPTRG